MKSENGKWLRRILEFSITLWATMVFQGLLFGSFVLFLRYLMEPFLIQQFGEGINLEIPHWLFFAAGIGVIVAFNALQGKPLLKDNNREQLEIVTYFVQKLPDVEKMQLYRRLANRLVDEFQLDKNIRTEMLKELESVQNQDENSEIEIQSGINAE